MEEDRTKEQLLAAERAQARRQAALFRLSAELAAALDEAEVCWRVVRGLQETLGYGIVALFLLDETTGDRIVAAHVGYEELPGYEGLPDRISPGKGLSELLLLDGQLHYTPDVRREPRYYPGAWGSQVDVPIRIGGQVLAVLSAENRETNAFNQDDFVETVQRDVRRFLRLPPPAGWAIGHPGGRRGGQRGRSGVVHGLELDPHPHLYCGTPCAT